MLNYLMLLFLELWQAPLALGVLGHFIFTQRRLPPSLMGHIHHRTHRFAYEVNMKFPNRQLNQYFKLKSAWEYS